MLPFLPLVDLAAWQAAQGFAVDHVSLLVWIFQLVSCWPLVTTMAGSIQFGKCRVRITPNLAGNSKPCPILSVHLSISRSVVRRVSEGVQSAVAKPQSNEMRMETNNMRVMVIVPGNKDSEAGVLPSKELLTEMGKFNEELVKAGVMLAGEGLHPTSKGVRVKFSGEKRTVIDGPFTESKELVAGFWLWQVKSMEEAIEWLKRAPFGGGVEIEIRPVFETADFGDNLTAELRAQEERLREQAAANKK